MGNKIGEIVRFGDKRHIITADFGDGCDRCVLLSCRIWNRKDRAEIFYKKRKIMEQKSVTINIPEGYEIDKEQSSFEKIVFKKKEKKVLTWEDLFGKPIPASSKYIRNNSDIESNEIKYDFNSYYDRNFFIDKKHAKSALAMAQISQLMPYYGGAITDEEWEDISVVKYVILRQYSKIEYGVNTNVFNFLAFHTKEQRDLFLKYNEQLVKDYLMMHKYF